MGLFEDKVDTLIVESTLRKVSEMNREQLEDLVIHLIKNYSITHMIISRLQDYATESVEIMLSLDEESPGSAEIIDNLFTEINERNENAGNSDSETVS